MVRNIIDRIRLDNNWVRVSLDENDFYLIAVKDKIRKGDNIKPEDIKEIKFELAIDSGIKNKPLTIRYISLDFSAVTSSDADTNKITAFTQLNNQPKDFYIRPIKAVTNDLTDIKAGEIAILINVNTTDLGD